MQELSIQPLDDDESYSDIFAHLDEQEELGGDHFDSLELYGCRLRSRHRSGWVASWTV